MEEHVVRKSLSNGHRESLMCQLNDFRKSEQFTDVTLVCNEITIVAHKNILAAASPYFLGMFSGHFPESTAREIRLEEMDSHCLQMAIDFIYTGHLNIDQDSVQQMLITATFLQLEHVADLCAEYMADQMDADNCLGFKSFAEKQNNLLLLEAAQDFILSNFQDVVQSEEFLEVPYAELASILSKEELYRHSEDAVLCGLARWAEHNPSDRIAHLGPLVRSIHPACVDAEMAQSLPILKEDSGSRQWLRDVMHCEGRVEWRVFILDKMGRQQDMCRFTMDFDKPTALKHLPRRAFAVSTVACKNILYMQGGSINRSTRDCFYYNIYRDEWYELSSLLKERSHHRSLILDDYLYAVGGNSLTGTTSTIECLNLVTNKAMYRENMLVKRSSMGAAVADNAIYVMGGETDHRSLFSVERYDPRVGGWEDLPPLREVNSYCSTAVIGNHIYCAEGLGSLMERFDLRANKWEIIDFWEEREFYEIFGIGNELYSTCSDSISRYDPDTNKWVIMYPFPEIREWDTAVAMPMIDITW